MVRGSGSIYNTLFSSAVALYAMAFPFDVVKGMQLNHKYALICVGTTLLKCPQLKH